MEGRRTVVGAALVRDGRVLAARRASPPELAGRWELPGGKVEPGEDPAAAVVREVHEELGCTVEPLGWLAEEALIGETHRLVVALVRLVAGEPVAREHDRLRWLGPDELDDVDWLEPDLPFLPGIRARMTAAVVGARAIFFAEEHAAATVVRLRRDGYDARLERERLAGEDDDEDHPWAVLSDAPLLALELLVDELDGWLDVPDGPLGADGPAPGTAAPTPVELPTQPRRRHR